MTVGQRIAQKRKELGLSQEGLGEQLGVSRQAIYKWESDTTLPEIEKLVAMSRIFSVSVGWLLGVEDEPAESGEKNSGELTAEQLHLVEEIVDRYLAARPEPQPRRCRRWPVVLVVCAAVIVLAVVLGNLFSKLGQVTRDYNNLQNSINGISTSVNNQIGAITNRVESILKSQNDLTAEYGTEIEDYDLRANTVTFRVWATPKTYTEGMTADFTAVSGGESGTQRGTLGQDRRYEAEVTCTLTDDITLSVVFSNGERQETQVLQTYDWLESSSRPEVYLYNGLWGYSDDGQLDAGDVAWISIDLNTLYYESKLGEVEIQDVKVGLFKDQKLVMWYDALAEKPDSFRGDWPENNRYFERPAAVTMEPGELYCEAALVTDEYGRQWMVCDGPVYYDAEEGFIHSADSTEVSRDPADWTLN